jgi:GT2 family glycosyltransferase
MTEQISRVSAVIVAYRSKKMLNNINNNCRLFDNFVLIDNSASAKDSIVDDLMVKYKNGTFPLNKKNLGYGGGNNLGLINARTDFALIINPDLEISREAVEAMIGTADAYPKAVVVGARVFDTRLNADQISYGWRYPDNGNAPYILPEGDVSTYWMSGCCLLIRIKPFLGLGGFDEKFFMYYEEYDVCERVIKSGGDCVLSSAAVVKHHSQSSSSPSLRVEYLKTLHWNRSKQIFLNKYGYEKKSKIGRISRVVGYAVIGAVQLMAFQLNRAVKSFALAHAHIIFY